MNRDERLALIRRWATIGYDSGPTDLAALASDVRWLLDELGRAAAVPTLSEWLEEAK